MLIRFVSFLVKFLLVEFLTDLFLARVSGLHDLLTKLVHCVCEGAFPAFCFYEVSYE